MTQRRTHTSLAVAELQNEVVFLADAPSVSTDVIEVTGIMEGDVLLSVLATADGGLTAPTEHAANCTIVEPRAWAEVDPAADTYDADEWVKIGLVKFMFKTAPVLVDSNYSVGSNRSERVVEVLHTGVAADDAAALAAAINDDFAKDVDGVTAEVVDTDHVRVTAKKPGDAAEGIAISKHASINAFEGANGGATLEILTGALAGITCTDDLTGAQASGGIEVRYRVAGNEAAQDVGAKLVGTYAAGDDPYDGVDDGNVGHGVGRLPPGWQP